MSTFAGTEVLPPGWTEASPGGMATNPDRMIGGIIDSEVLPGQWFVIFNDRSVPPVHGLASRAHAFQALHETLLARGDARGALNSTKGRDGT